VSGPARVACVEIGGVPISLSTCDTGFFHLLRRRYHGFLSNSRPAIDLEFEIISGGSVSDDDVRVRRDGRDWLIERGDFRAIWNPQTRKGTVRQNSNPYSLDSVLRILHSLILAEQGGFLLHAASAVCEHQACLFSGVSGAGKTTMTRLAPPDVTLLTDEISYIRPETGSWRAFGTPFAGELARPGDNTSAKVAALFFLEKGPQNRIDNVPLAEAVQRLMRNILFFAHDNALVDQIFASACNFASTIPIRRLTFYPDSKVWGDVRDYICGLEQPGVSSESVSDEFSANV